MHEFFLEKVKIFELDKNNVHTIQITTEKK